MAPATTGSVMAEKTEKPTPKRLREARRKGQVARSRTLGAVGGLALGVIALTATARSAAAIVYRFAVHAFGSVASPNAIGPILDDAASAARSASLPILVAALAGTVVANAAQVGFSLRLEALSPSFEKINPIEGAKRMWSPKALIDLLKATVTVVGVLAVAYSGLKSSLRDVVLAPGASPLKAITTGADLASRIAMRAMGVGLLMAAVDYALQRRSFLQGLMMSKDEIKQEHKDSDGDPHVKAKRKRMAREISAGTAKRGVRHATTVVVNPTHLAVCIRYDPDECEAPTITEKGVGERALRIKHEAHRLGVPVTRDIPLARSLIHLDVGDEIPEELYEAVAVVLKTAMEMAEKQVLDDSRRKP